MSSPEKDLQEAFNALDKSITSENLKNMTDEQLQEIRSQLDEILNDEDMEVDDNA